MKTVQCRGCGAPMVWLKSAAGNAMPINADTVHEGDTVYDHTRHVSHHATCPKADKFRRRKSPKPQRAS